MKFIDLFEQLFALIVMICDSILPLYFINFVKINNFIFHFSPLMFILEIILHIQSFLIDINSSKNYNNSFHSEKNYFPISRINEVDRQWNHVFII